MLGLNDTQTSVLTLVFKYCDDQQLPLLDFGDLRAVLQYLSGDAGEGGARRITAGCPRPRSACCCARWSSWRRRAPRQFFGEPEFDVHDLLPPPATAAGVVTCLELADVQDKPRLFSTFMMWMLAELYHNLPEAGDLDKPKLVFFFDEAHLLFDDASKAFLEQVEQVVRLIRSKGVGVYFVTQTPKDVPADVLAQLGNRVQHALRAHTPDDETALNATARTFPKTAFYDLEETLTSLGIGEAVVTVLDPRGVPTPVVADAADPARVPDGAAHARGAAGRHPAVGPAGGVRQGDRSGERPGDARRPPDQVRTRGPGDWLNHVRRSSERRTSGCMSAGAKIGAAVVGALGTTMARTVGRELVRGVFGMLGAKPSGGRVGPGGREAVRRRETGDVRRGGSGRPSVPSSLSLPLSRLTRLLTLLSSLHLSPPSAPSWQTSKTSTGDDNEVDQRAEHEADREGAQRPGSASPRLGEDEPDDRHQEAVHDRLDQLTGLARR